MTHSQHIFIWKDTENLWMTTLTTKEEVKTKAMNVSAFWGESNEFIPYFLKWMGQQFQQRLTHVYLPLDYRSVFIKSRLAV